MPPETAAEKLYRKHQELRKKRGAPDPEEYKKMAAQKQKEIDAMKNEETEQLDEMPESSMKTRDVHAHLKKSGWALKRTSGGHDVYGHPKSKENISVPRHKQLKAPLIRGIMKASKVSEETEIEEQLYKKGRFVSDPAKKPFKSATIVSPVKEAKDEREYGYEGDMALNQLATLTRCAEMIKDLLKPDTDMPEWIQSKITLATDYIQTAADYMYSEMKEEVELTEGRPSQRHPLEGHDYHKKSNAELIGIAKDAHAAAEAMKGHSPRAENKYRDQANDSATVRYFRQKNGMPDWYKKKYGHMKEEVEQLDEVGDTKKGQKLLHMVNKRAVDRLVSKRADKDPAYAKKAMQTHLAADERMKEEVEYLEEKNEPTNPALWSKAKSLAKQKFDVYPSAYANGWAAKWYKGKGGGWKSVSESVNEAADDESKPVLSRKAQIVRDAARKKDSPEKFEKNPELSSEIHKT